MRKMKLYELVNQYHIGTNLSCAEAMFKACNEYYHLHLSEETRRMFSVMGIGMQTEQSCCGAFTVAVGIIGLMTAKDGETDADNIEGYRMIYDLTGHVPVSYTHLIEVYADALFRSVSIFQDGEKVYLSIAEHNCVAI